MPYLVCPNCGTEINMDRDDNIRYEYIDVMESFFGDVCHYICLVCNEEVESQIFLDGY